jgi:hypothetical protein
VQQQVDLNAIEMYFFDNQFRKRPVHLARQGIHLNPERKITPSHFLRLNIQAQRSRARLMHASALKGSERFKQLTK